MSNNNVIIVYLTATKNSFNTKNLVYHKHTVKMQNGRRYYIII